MKGEPAYRYYRHRIEIGAGKPFITLASVAIAWPPASRKSALRLGLTFGAVAALGLSIGQMCPQLAEVDPENPLLPVCGALVNNVNNESGFQLPQEELNSAVQTLNGEEVQAMQQQVATCRPHRSPPSARAWTQFGLVWRRRA
jgi:hypothetical protein